MRAAPIQQMYVCAGANVPRNVHVFLYKASRMRAYTFGVASGRSKRFRHSDANNSLTY